MLAERIGVLLAAGGALWEVEALQVVSARPSGAVLLKRCVDLPDLLATGATGQARVAVVAAELPGLDADSLGQLRSAGMAVVLVTSQGTSVASADLPGVFEVVDATGVASLADVIVAAAGEAEAPPDPRVASSSLTQMDSPLPVEHAVPTDAVELRGRVLAVWGPTGAPGRTTVAVGVAGELARRGQDVLVVDADPYGGAVGQHLGVLDEASGLLGAVRLANAGKLDVPRLAASARTASARTVAPGLRVLTGLPRADRWAEVRALAYDSLLETARRLCPYVVLDLGFDLEQPEQAFGSSGPQRNLMTVAGLDQADEILVVGSADPVGLARLARALVELPEVAPAPAPRVVVNRVRPSLGWGEKQVRAMVEGFVTPASMHFLPNDPVGADRALVAGRPLVETGESALRAALARVVDGLEGEWRPGAREGDRRAGRLRRRRAGRAR